MRIPYGAPVAIGRRFIDLDPEVTAIILQTIADGWAIAAAHSDVTSGAKEVPVTERLRDGMRQALEASTQPWAHKLVVLPGTESRSQPEVLIPDGRTDIPLFFTPIFEAVREHDPHAIIECKRLKCGDAYLAKEYVVEGIDRFRAGKYGANHARGFMAGYVAGGEVFQAVQDVNDYLTKSGRDPEGLSTAAGLADWVRRSAHPRDTGKPIEVLHAVLLQS